MEKEIGWYINYNCTVNKKMRQKGKLFHFYMNNKEKNELWRTNIFLLSLFLPF